MGHLLASTPGLMSVPLEMQLLFIGAVYLGTLIISRFSIRIGLPAVLGVLLLGLLINLQILDVHPSEVERLQTFSLALLLFYAGLKTDIQANQSSKASIRFIALTLHPTR